MREEVREQCAAAVGVCRRVPPAGVEFGDMGRGDVLELQFAERRLDMQAKVALVLLDGSWLLVGLGILVDVAVREFRECWGLRIDPVRRKFCLPLLGRIDFVRHPPKQALRFLAGFVGSPGRAVLPDRVALRASLATA